MVVVLLSHFMLFTLLNIVIPVVALTGVGFLMGRRHSARPDMAFINHANVTVFCPALVFSALMANPVSVGEGWPLIAAAILIVVVPGLVLYWLTPAGMTRETFLVTGMFRNTGNVGIPLMVLAYGNDLLGDIVLLFVLSNLLHFSLGLFILSRGGSSWLWLRNPNIWAAVLGVICAPYAHLFPGFVLTSLEMLGQVVIPLMLFALGVRLAEGRITQVMTALRINLIYLMVGAICLPLILWILPLTPEWTRLIILSGLLPPAVLNYLLTEQYNMDAQTVANVVLFGNILAVLTVPIIVWLTLAWV